MIDLSGGAIAEVATYLPGRRVVGVRLSDEVVEVHVVASLSRPLPDTAADVRSAVRSIVHDGRPVEVFIEDVDESVAAGALTAGAGPPKEDGRDRGAS